MNLAIVLLSGIQRAACVTNGPFMAIGEFVRNSCANSILTGITFEDYWYLGLVSS